MATAVVSVVQNISGSVQPVIGMVSAVYTHSDEKASSGDQPDEAFLHISDYSFGRTLPISAFTAASPVTSRLKFLTLSILVMTTTIAESFPAS